MTHTALNPACGHCGKKFCPTCDPDGCLTMLEVARAHEDGRIVQWSERGQDVWRNYVRGELPCDVKFLDERLEWRINMVPGVECLETVNVELLEALRNTLPFVPHSAYCGSPNLGPCRGCETRAAIRRAEEKCSCLPLPEPPNDTCPIHGIEGDAK